jgi:tRNA pseudouridine65 synthase
VKPPPRPASLPRLAVLHRDDDVLVVDKPSGLAIHRGAAVEHDTVAARLAEHEPGASAVHRLDRGTSGALVVARYAEAARALAEAFEAGRVAKCYVALVRGEVGPAEVLVDHAIPGDEGGPRVGARTRIRGLATLAIAGSPLREARYSWIEARPETGRFHQVRRHAKHLGHPIVGDTNYGRSEHNALVRERFGIARLALHASAVTLPALGARATPLAVHAPVPIELIEALVAMGFERRVLEPYDAP